MLRFAALLASLALAACATAPEPSAPQTRAQALASLLLATEAADPARIDASVVEMTALEAALTRAPVIEVAPEPAVAAAPEPLDLSGARSVMSAVHLASYRQRAHAVSGWAQMTRRHGELADRTARLSEVDLRERGVFLRLKAGPFDTPGEAEAACDAVKARGDWCAVTDFSGEPL
ncbi:MAG: hypothetical protein ACFE0P_00610 [Oceanicaulis sp.]